MSASSQIIYWRDIPAQVRVREAAERFSLPLSLRFQKAIDSAAVRSGLTGTDAYLDQWRTTPWQPSDADPQSTAAALVAELEDSYNAERLESLIHNNGFE
jgi:hypothetical protein